MQLIFFISLQNYFECLKQTFLYRSGVSKNLAKCLS